jgi:hypothetical protein
MTKHNQITISFQFRRTFQTVPLLFRLPECSAHFPKAAKSRSRRDSDHFHKISFVEMHKPDQIFTPRKKSRENVLQNVCRWYLVR